MQQQEQSRGRTDGEEAEHGATVVEAGRRALEELVLDVGVPLCIVDAVQVPRTDRVLQVLHNSENLEQNVCNLFESEEKIVGVALCVINTVQVPRACVFSKSCKTLRPRTKTLHWKQK